jgi:glyoxylase-like metal-dependent hydrolase (beta-lactamase superfamily II)
MIIVDQITSGTIDTNGYVVGDPVTRKGLFIDAPERGAPRMRELAAKHGLTITYIVNTHGHWDHIPDNSALRKNTGAKVAVHTDDGHYLLNPTTLLFQLPFSIEPLVPDEYLSDNQILEIGSLKFIVLHTPGHTPGSICLYEPNEKVLFSGDTLFAGSVGRTDLPGGDWNILLESIKERILTLPDTVTVYPGHGPSSTIGDERIGNPFLE